MFCFDNARGELNSDCKMERAFHRSWIAALLFAAIVGSVAAAGGTNSTVTSIGRLNEKLMNYDKSATPGALTGESTKIEIGLYLMRLQYDVLAKTASSVMYFRQRWNDRRLAFNQKKTMDKTMPVIHVADWDRIWIPDTFFSNQVAPLTVDHRLLKIAPNGDVWFVQRLFITTPLYTNLAEGYIVPFKIESFGRTNESIFFTFMNSPVDVDLDFISPMPINAIKCKDCTQTYSTGSYPCLSFNIHVEKGRNHQFVKQFSIISLLSVIVVVVSCSAFWLSPSSTAGIVSRVLIGLATLAIAFSIGYANREVGQTESLLTSSDIMIGGCIFVAMAAFIESVVVIALGSGDTAVSKTTADLEIAQSNRQWNARQRITDFTAKLATPAVFFLFVIASVVKVHL